MPLLTPRGIEAALRRLPDEEIDMALRERLFAAAWSLGIVHYATGSDAAHALATAAGLDVRLAADPDDLKSTMQRLFSRRLNWLSSAFLQSRMPGWSAKIRLTPWQGVCAFLCLAIASAALVTVPGAIFRMTAALVISLFFLAVIALRILSAMPLPRVRTAKPAAILPVYTVLVPLFREISVLDQLLDALDSIDYPALGSKRRKFYPAE